MKFHSLAGIAAMPHALKTRIVPSKQGRWPAWLAAFLLAACGTAPEMPAGDSGVASVSGPDAAVAAIQRPASEWVPVGWGELPGWEADELQGAWNAWLRSCERPSAAWVPLCPEVRQLAIGSDAERRAWMQARLQAYRVQQGPGRDTGLLTSYYEPQLRARRQPDALYRHALYQPPAGVSMRAGWLTRQEIDTSGEARDRLRGREIAYLADPVDVLILQIQGSGRVMIEEPDGRITAARLAFAASNEQPYQSVARWLLERREIRDASWPSIKAWVRSHANHPDKVNQMFWSNPRVVFFREEALPADAQSGPRGAQGVPLTAGRSIAVDRHSIPYGTPVWLASRSDTLTLHRLVLAQDTGSAIVGAVRADYFAGAGDEAGDMAGRVKQPLRLWALWPRDARP